MFNTHYNTLYRYLFNLQVSGFDEQDSLTLCTGSRPTRSQGTCVMVTIALYVAFYIYVALILQHISIRWRYSSTSASGGDTPAHQHQVEILQHISIRWRYSSTSASGGDTPAHQHQVEILQHISIRWLSLECWVSYIVHLYNALKSYYRSTGRESY